MQELALQTLVSPRLVFVFSNQDCLATLCLLLLSCLDTAENERHTVSLEVDLARQQCSDSSRFLQDVQCHFSIPRTTLHHTGRQNKTGSLDAEDTWRKKYPNVSAKMDELESRLEALEKKQ